MKGLIIQRKDNIKINKIDDILMQEENQEQIGKIIYIYSIKKLINFSFGGRGQSISF